MIWHIEKIETLISFFGSDEKLGLSAENANAMRAKFGENNITPPPQKFKIIPFILDIISVRLVLLFAAFVISIVYAIINPEYSPFEALVLLLAFIIYLGAKTLIFFKKQKNVTYALSADENAVILRDGKECLIKACDLVVGDILVLRAGNKIPADARIITAQSLTCDEYNLTGKSAPILKKKDAILSQKADFKKQTNMLFAGSFIITGQATAIVVATGDNMVIAQNDFNLKQKEPKKTPFQRKLLLTTNSFNVIGLLLFAIVFLLGILINRGQNNNLVLIMLFAVSILPVNYEWLYNLSTSHFIKILAKLGICVKNISAFENLAKTKVLAIPKNNVLTENNVEIEEIWCGDEYTEPLTATLSNEAFAVIKMSALCSNLNPLRKDDTEPLGQNPIDTAIITALHKNGTEKSDLDAEFTRLAHIPFNSDRRLMTTVNMLGNIPVVITKGAFDSVSAKCVEGISENAIKCYQDMCSHGLNVVAVAYKRIASLPDEIRETTLENELILLGLIGFSEKIKDDVNECLADLRDAGIKTLLFSDSDLRCCTHLASRLGIAEKGTLSADDDTISTLDFSSDILSYRVFPHLSKESKMLLLRLWKKSGITSFVATNKIPDYTLAKACDVSCAIGENSADILKNSADIVVNDYDLSSLISAVVTGRKSLQNIRKAIQFVSTCNLSLLLNFIIFTFAGLSMPISSMGLLLAVVFTIFIPALSLVFQPAEYDIMQDTKYNKKSGLITRDMFFTYLLNGIVMAISNFALYLFVNDDLLSHSAFFISICSLNIIFLMCTTSRHSLFVAGFSANRRVVFSVVLAILVVVATIFVPPVANFVGVTTLTSELYSVVFALAVVLFILNEIIKLAILIKHRLF
ncbi:MAG: cation-transporting P-type ATPase [Oscillospiraceae bacterium]|nr:cation-transporting P-type ATPase [Oscillospiraceae bacterium]